MRGVPLWLKINVAVAVAFLVVALVLGNLLRQVVADGHAEDRQRTHAMLLAVAAPSLERLAPLLAAGRTGGAVQAVVSRLVDHDGVSGAALFGADGRLLARAGQPAGEPPVFGDAGATSGRGIFTVRADRTAVLLEPVADLTGTLGFLRLRAALGAPGGAERRLWLLFALGLVVAYGLAVGLLYACLRRSVLRPADALRLALLTVECGRLDQELPVAPGDVLGRTVAAFNDMIVRLRQTSRCVAASRAEMAEQRRLLELRVETRTAELAETNARLMTEIVGRRRVEEERERLLTLYRVILESRAEAVVCSAAGEDRRVLAVNRRFLELLDLPDDWADREREARLSMVLAKIKGGAQAKTAFLALMHDAETLSEDVLELHDGRFLERRSGPIRQGRTFVGRVFSYVDVTDRRRDEASLRQALAQRDVLLGNSQVGLATVRGHICLDINRRGAEILGYTREELLGRPSRLFFAKESDYQSSVQEFAARLERSEAISVERQLRCRDGSEVWVRAHARVVHGGPLWEVVWAFDDITPDMARQARLEQARREAVEASRAKGAFLAVMSHEIRTPLNVIMGLTELLLGQNATEEQHGYLGTIRDSANHLLGIINDILDFSKIEAGKLALEQVDFDLPGLVALVARGMAVQARQKDLDFTVTVAPDVPAILRGDPGRLRQVLVNLLGNAVKFTETGSVGLQVERVDAMATPAGKVGLALRVTDTGIGIPTERLPELFLSFQQGANSIARRFGGTGLGLAITKEIVERMGGHIEASSAAGRGSVFACTVFLEPGDPTKVPAGRGAAETVADVLADRPLRVLLVEDNILNATVTRLHLSRLGHDLTLAASARDAYARLAETTYDVVLMDIEMPEIDGITATRAIRAGGPEAAPVLDAKVPIVAVTAHAVEDIRQQCLEAGMDGFVTKPINYRTLELALRRLDHYPGQDEAPPPAPALSDAAVAVLFDPAAAREAMGISWKDYGALSLVSYGEGRDRLVEMRERLAAGDGARAAIAAHTFKGTAATMGASSCRELGVALEQALRTGNLRQAGELLDRLGPLWEAAGRALEAWQMPPDPPR